MPIPLAGSDDVHCVRTIYYNNDNGNIPRVINRIDLSGADGARGTHHLNYAVRCLLSTVDAIFSAPFAARSRDRLIRRRDPVASVIIYIYPGIRGAAYSRVFFPFRVALMTTIRAIFLNFSLLSPAIVSMRAEPTKKLLFVSFSRAD